jgi:hypothetical protein
MDSQSYLNEISSSVRPMKQPRASLLSNKFVLVGIICLVGIILMAIIGSVLGGGKSGVKEQSIDLKLRLDSTSEVISNYQTYVKSSDLRSSSATLSGVISNTNRDLSNYLSETYEFKSADKKVQEKEDARKQELEDELFEAKINGIMDRIYAHKMDYEISIILTMENKLYNAASNDTLKEIIGTSINSLQNIQEKFAGFSETK